MIYTLDTEFYEFPSAMGGTIQWISIGLVSEDGRTFYAENDCFDWGWLERMAAGDDEWLADTPRWLLENVRPHLRGGDHEMSKREVREALEEFCDDKRPEFWGWYCDYDWVVFCWLWGRMIDLPENFPKFCRDLRQAIDATDLRAKDIPMDGAVHDALADARWNMKVYNEIRAQIQI